MVRIDHKILNNVVDLATASHVSDYPISDIGISDIDGLLLNCFAQPAGCGAGKTKWGQRLNLDDLRPVDLGKGCPRGLL